MNAPSGGNDESIRTRKNGAMGSNYGPKSGSIRIGPFDNYNCQIHRTTITPHQAHKSSNERFGFVGTG